MPSSALTMNVLNRVPGSDAVYEPFMGMWVTGSIAAGSLSAELSIVTTGVNRIDAKPGPYPFPYPGPDGDAS